MCSVPCGYEETRWSAKVRLAEKTVLVSLQIEPKTQTSLCFFWEKKFHLGYPIISFHAITTFVILRRPLLQETRTLLLL